MRSLQIQINGDTRSFSDGITLLELINQIEMPAQRIAVELNREVVRRSDWETTLLNDGDKVEIVHFVGGGAE